jgi:8-oxo-dGTP pyrophosphatase MutT (NUDIX family)
MFKNIPNKCYKTEDGELWLSRSVAVVGIIFAITDNFTMRVLTVKRSETMPDKPNRWCLPCGYLDYGETLEEAVEREVYEETGFLMRDHSKRLLRDMPYFHIDSDHTKSNRQNISVSFAKVYMFEKLPELVLNSEASALEWTPINEANLKALDLTFGHYDLVMAVQKELNRINF